MFLGYSLLRVLIYSRMFGYRTNFFNSCGIYGFLLTICYLGVLGFHLKTWTDFSWRNRCSSLISVINFRNNINFEQHIHSNYKLYYELFKKLFLLLRGPNQFNTTGFKLETYNCTVI